MSLAALDANADWGAPILHRSSLSDRRKIEAPRRAATESTANSAGGHAGLILAVETRSSTSDSLQLHPTSCRPLGSDGWHWDPGWLT